MKAVTAGKLNHVSASQITTFQRCKRRWRYQKVECIPEPEKVATAEGTRIHEGQEKHYEHGIRPTHQSAVLALDSGLLPGRDPSLRIEHPRNYALGLTIAGVPVRGRMDLLVARVPVSEVWDWKSAKSFRYCKSPDELREDVQLNIYGCWVFENIPGAEGVEYAHAYLRTELDNPGFKVVRSGVVDREHVVNTVRGLEPVVAEMQAVAQAASPADVTPNYDACWDYGGCPYRAICPRLQAESFTELEAQTQAGAQTQADFTYGGTLADKLKRAHGVNPPDANYYTDATTPPAPGATTATPLPADARPLADRLRNPKP